MSDQVELSWQIGAVSITRIEETITSLPTKVLVPDVTEEHLDRHRDWVAPYFEPSTDDGPMLRLSIHSFVVQSGETTIVVDTCVGADPERSLPGDPTFADRLEDTLPEGLDGVDVVVCTHLHFDHVGWNTRVVDGVAVPTFRNARYLVTRAEMDEVEADDHMAVREPSIVPLRQAGLLDLIDVDPRSGHQLTDEVVLIATPGHTAGHVSVLIESEGRSALITGDAFHSPIQVAHPELAAWRFDSDSDQSTATRVSLIDRFVDSETLVLGTHFAPPTAGRFRRGEETVWFEAVSAEVSAE